MRRKVAVITLLGLIGAVGGRAQDEATGASASDVWIDPGTGLMWAARDNGSAVQQRQALSYCHNQKLAGFRDWRLPEIDELAGLFDNTVAQRPPGARNDVHVKGGIRLTACCGWSATSDGWADGSAFAWDFNFEHAERESGVLSNRERALCVRGVSHASPPTVVSRLGGTPKDAQTALQSKIIQLQSQIESAQAQAQNDDAEVARLRISAASSGGGLAGLIGSAGAAGFEADARRQRQAAASLTTQLQQLQQQSAAAASQQAAQAQLAATMAASQNGAPGAGPNQATNQQTQEQALDRQSRIEQLQADLQSKQDLVAMYTGNAADLRRQQAAAAGQPGAAASAAILQIGIDKFDQDAQQAQQDAAGIQSQLAQLQQLQQQSAAAGSQQAAAVAQNGQPGSGISQAPSQQAAAEPDNAYDPNRHYSGPNADEVAFLLSRVSGWSCPTSISQPVKWTPPVQQNCMRDLYVSAAVAAAYSAECEARLNRNQEAASAAQFMMEDIKNARSMCSNVPVFATPRAQACSTLSLVPCP